MASPIMDTVLDEIVRTAVVHDVVTVHEGANQPAPTAATSVVVKVDAVQAQSPANTASSVAPVAAETSPPSTTGLPLTYQANLDTESATYQGLVLLNHNIHRANHSVPDLVYNSTLASYAEQIAKTCFYNHSKAAGDGNYGQNIGAGIDAGNISALLTNMLYNDEIENYPLPYGQDVPDGSQFEQWGHFSQMVWSDTTSVGCYTYDCSPAGQPTTQDCNANGQPYLANTNCGPDGGTPAVFTVCNYYPAGNVDGEYEAVKAPLGHGIVQMTENGLAGPDL
ncbi:hypothetical protein HO173_004146 [Letharia columbiana]|uniref:SCP domain-containing protein n=1 Tax=Letharia columbiana TaxID=112416 RepID=A0A8H6FZY9_9LECA|nr:uncharacterized protein HO173_004146 [Letharia columbiana]KAF6237945.1 hypothetical protein HO173_004146 [Letharia columbiana]